MAHGGDFDEEEEESGSWLSHINMVIGTSFCVLSLVIAYIVYIIHLYDSGKLGGVGPEKSKTTRTSSSSTAADNVAQRKWDRKLWKDD